MRIQSLLILIPCIAGFFWLLAYVLFAPRTPLFRKLTRFIAVFSFFFLFGFLSADPESKLMLHFTLFEQVCALALIPCFLSYMMEYTGKDVVNLYFKICCMLPLVHMIVGIESVYTAGFWDASRVLIDSYSVRGPVVPFLENNGLVVFYACYTYVFGAFLLICFMLFAINIMSCAINGNCGIGDVVGFFFKGKKTDLAPVQFFLTLLILLIIVPALLLGRRCYVDNVPVTIAACVVLALLLSMISFVGTAGSERRKSIRGLLNAVRFGTDDADFVQVSEPSTSAAVASGNGSRGLQPASGVLPPDGAVSPDASDEHFRETFDSDFKKFMLDDRMYLRNDLSLTIAADILLVERAVLSDYIEKNYGMSFMNYVNKLRVEYAEQYMLDHDDVRQRDIAYACGFSGASAFNTAFSKITGVTPKIWKDRRIEMSKRV